MTWEPKRRRWRKTCNGVEYVVSCAELNCESATKAASVGAANKWWKLKQRELRSVDEVESASVECSVTWLNEFFASCDEDSLILLADHGTEAEQYICNLYDAIRTESIFRSMENYVARKQNERLAKQAIPGQPVARVVPERRTVPSVKRPLVHMRDEDFKAHDDLLTPLFFFGSYVPYFPVSEENRRLALVRDCCSFPEDERTEAQIGVTYLRLVIAFCELLTTRKQDGQQLEEFPYLVPPHLLLNPK